MNTIGMMTMEAGPFVYKYIQLQLQQSNNNKDISKQSNILESCNQNNPKITLSIM